jgi:hypothetical protein
MPTQDTTDGFCDGPSSSLSVWRSRGSQTPGKQGEELFTLDDALAMCPACGIEVASKRMRFIISTKLLPQWRTELERQLPNEFYKRVVINGAWHRRRALPAAHAIA